MSKNVKSIIVLTAISLVVALALSAINMFTSPVIEKNAAAKADGAYLEVLPEATTFATVEGEFPASVLEMKKDEGGSGFAFKLNASSSYSQSPMEMILGINNEGKITKLVITNYAETKGNKVDFETLFEGKDATTSDIVAGVTYTSNAIKDAIKAAYYVFYEYADIEKTDEQKLMDLYSKLLPYGTDKTGAFAMTSVELPEGTPDAVTAIYAPNTCVGYIITATAGDKTVAMAVNAFGKVFAIYDLDGNDLSADASLDTLKTDIAASIPSVYDTNNDKIVGQMVEVGVIGSANNAQKVDFSAVSNRVVAVYKITGGTAYIARAEGYGGVLTVCYVFNNAGQIVKYATLEQFEVAELEYMHSEFGTVIANDSYAEKIVGKNNTTLTENDVIIAGSTFTSNATKACWNDIKAAYETMNKEEVK